MSQNTHYSLSETYPSARMTPELVGRDDVLRQIQNAIRDTATSYVIHVTGSGGVGKTMLLRRILNEPAQGFSLLVAQDLIDLYHTAHHTPEGMADAIQKLLVPDGDGFESYQKERERLEAHNVREEGIDRQRQKMLKAFLDDVRRLAEHNRIVLALDTVERLFSRDPVADQLGLVEERPVVLDWLLRDFLPNVENAVILLAGRPESGDLRANLSRVEGKVFIPVNLQGFTQEETRAYFDAVASLAEETNDAATAQWLRSLPDEQRQVIFRYLCDFDEQGHSLGVRPILLALVIDYLAISGRILPALTASLKEAESKSPAECRQILDELERGLVRVIQETGRPADDVIRDLARAPKGMDAELLARVADLRKLDGTYDIDQAQTLLDSLRNLSFVKVRPADNRVFLHDEMYDLLRRHILDHPGSMANAERVYQAMRGYYKDRINQARDDIARLYREQPEKAPLEPEAAISARMRLQDALVEDLYYQLRYDLAAGFQAYFSYAEEAVWTNNESLDIQLRAELLNLLSDERRYAERQKDTIRILQIDRLMQEVVKPDAAVRWVKRLVSRGRFDDAVRIAERLHADAASLIEAGGDLVKAELNSWEGLVYTYKGNVEIASRKINDDALKRLTEMEVPEENLLRWSAALAQAYNYSGYLARVQTQFIRASEAYHAALPHWRYLGMEVEQANTLNNLAYALSLRGEFDIARRQGMDALHLRERLGRQGPVVLSLTTLAEIEIYAGNYREAQGYAERALNLARLMSFRRGEGLALLALAALSRFQAEPEQVKTVTERRKLLDKSLECAREAGRVFTDEVPELEREIKAHYEEGLTLRELCRPPALEGVDRETVFSAAEERLVQAAGKAREHALWLLYLDASLGRAWLYYYMNKREQIEELFKLLNQVVQEHFANYQISSRQFPERDATTVLGIFGQLARAHVLRGILSLDAYEVSSKQLPSKDMDEAAQQFTLAFEYDALMTREFRDTQRAANVIYGRLKKFNPRELSSIYDAVTRVPGQMLPADKQVKDLLFWAVLQEHLGPYEIHRRLTLAG